MWLQEARESLGIMGWFLYLDCGELTHGLDIELKVRKMLSVGKNE
jgi:hypothetical protein